MRHDKLTEDGLGVKPWNLGRCVVGAIYCNHWPLTLWPFLVLQKDILPVPGGLPITISCIGIFLFFFLYYYYYEMTRVQYSKIRSIV
jgi:hypothetical protein